MNKKVLVIAVACGLSILGINAFAQGTQYFSGNISEAELLQAFTGGQGAASEPDMGQGGTRAIVFGAAAPMAAPTPAPQQAAEAAVESAEPAIEIVEAAPAANACDPSRSVAVNIQFGYDSANIGDGEQAKIGTIARVLSNPVLSNCQIVVEGHTDAKGDYSYNEQLSERRAQSVVAALANNNITGGRMSAIGYGSAVLYNEDDPYDGTNRRVEFRLR